jgi:hypothetical protein
VLGYADIYIFPKLTQTLKICIFLSKMVSDLIQQQHFRVIALIMAETTAMPAIPVPIN